jgi:hypothetical protein
MAGGEGIKKGQGFLIIATALAAAATAAAAQTQTPSWSSATPPSNLGSVVGGPGTVAQPTGAVPSGYACEGFEATASRGGMGPWGTVTESIFGKPDPNTWRPLSLSTLFSEGWSEAWVPSPNGSGGAPRQGWINAADGNLYRLGFLTFAQGFNDAPKGNAYLGADTLMTPLSRRLELITNVPFVLRNNADTGLPVDEESGQTVTRTQSHTGFGDITFTPRVLLEETQDFSLTAELAVGIPTGTQPLAGNRTTLTPNISFWDNIAGRVVIRGGVGVLFPTDGSGDEFIGQLAIGQTLTDHDVPLLGDFTYYLSMVVDTPLSNSDLTRVTLTPGIRTHLGHDWYFLAGLPVPVTKERVADLGMIFWFMKAW